MSQAHTSSKMLSIHLYQISSQSVSLDWSCFVGTDRQTRYVTSYDQCYRFNTDMGYLFKQCDQGIYCWYRNRRFITVMTTH